MAFLNLNLSPAKIQSNTLLKKSFLTAGILFALICVIGVATKYIIDATGTVSAMLQGTTRWNVDFLKGGDEIMNRAKIIFIVGGALVVISSIMSIVWVFRLNKASKAFIGIFYTIYAVGQGIGFGILFMMFKSIELMGIFGVAGGIFMAMGLIGYKIKDGTKLFPFIMIGLGVWAVLAIASVIMYFTGVYSDTLVLLMTILSGGLTCLYVIVDVWYIRTSQQFYGLDGMDKETEFRAVAFFGFRLASDLISLIWTIARLYLFTKKR